MEASNLTRERALLGQREMVEPCSWNLLALTAAHEQNRAADRTYINNALLSQHFDNVLQLHV